MAYIGSAGHVSWGLIYLKNSIVSVGGSVEWLYEVGGGGGLRESSCEDRGRCGETT